MKTGEYKELAGRQFAVDVFGGKTYYCCDACGAGFETLLGAANHCGKARCGGGHKYVTPQQKGDDSMRTNPDGSVTRIGRNFRTEETPDGLMYRCDRCDRPHGEVYEAAACCAREDERKQVAKLKCNVIQWRRADKAKAPARRKAPRQKAAAPAKGRHGFAAPDEATVAITAMQQALAGIREEMGALQAKADALSGAISILRER